MARIEQWLLLQKHKTLSNEMPNIAGDPLYFFFIFFLEQNAGDVTVIENEKFNYSAIDNTNLERF